MAKDPTQTTQDEVLDESGVEEDAPEIVIEGEVEVDLETEDEQDEETDVDAELDDDVEDEDETEESDPEDDAEEVEIGAEDEVEETEDEVETEVEESEDDSETETKESVYSTLSSKELSEALKERDLPVSGNKAAKIERLIKNDFEPAEGTVQSFLEFLAEENVPVPPGGAYSDVSPTNDEKILWAVTSSGEYYLALDESVRDWKPTVLARSPSMPTTVPGDVQMSVQVRRKKESAQQ